MSEFYIKSIEPGMLVKRNGNKTEQMIRVTVSSFKIRSDLTLAAEYDGAVIGEKKFNISIGDNIIEFFIEAPPVPRSVLFKLFHRDYMAHYHEADIMPYKH